MKPSLIQILFVFFVGLVLALGGLLYFFDTGSRRSLTVAADALLEQSSGEVESQAVEFFKEAEAVVSTFADLASRNLVETTDVDSLERCFVQSLVAHPNLGEVGLTYASPAGGWLPDGTFKIKPRPRSQVTVYRDRKRPGVLVTRWVRQNDQGFVEHTRTRTTQGVVSPWSPPTKVESDPCEHYTFSVPVEKDFYGKPLWSDLHWAPRDADLPAARRQVELSVQQVVQKRQGTFQGVLRVGLRAEQLDTLVQAWKTRMGDVPLTIFLCDMPTDDEDKRLPGRLVTRLKKDDPLVELSDAYRIQPKFLPGDVKAALQRVPEVTEDTWQGRVQSGGQTYLVAFRKLKKAQDWLVGVTIPERFYLGELRGARQQVLVASGVVVTLVLLILAALFVRVRKDLAFLTSDTSRMVEFQFDAAPGRTHFREVQRVADGLERAKTALRTLSKYTPVQIVREIVRTNREPALGGETREVTLLFTDVQNFTTYAEQLGINETAAMLGDYLEVMGRGIQDNHGTVLEYVGDAIVAVWNAPTPSGTHVEEACQAVITCQHASGELCSTTQWRRTRPDLVTRYGIHTAEVVVGHFGAVNRMSYRVIGDGANLASRIEGLNKLYGTTALATGSAWRRVRERFDFRLVDRVIVKGRSEPVDLYELLGRRGFTDEARLATAAAYSEAFELYHDGRFGDAEPLFAALRDDPPAQTLAARCRTYLQNPPTPWRGVYTATEK